MKWWKFVNLISALVCAITLPSASGKPVVRTMIKASVIVVGCLLFAGTILVAIAGVLLANREFSMGYVVIGFLGLVTYIVGSLIALKS